MNLHIFTYILHLPRVYYKLAKWPAPSWLYSSVHRALHQYRNGHGFKSLSGFNFTTAVCITVMINHIFKTKIELYIFFSYVLFVVFGTFFDINAMSFYRTQVWLNVLSDQQNL